MIKEDKIKEFGEKFNIILMIGLILLFFNVGILLNSYLFNATNTINYDIMKENIELKIEAKQLMIKLTLANRNLKYHCNNTNNITPIIKESFNEKLKEIDCMVNRLEWDTLKQEWIETNIFTQPPTCYEIIKK